jgi:nicotinamidase-related amidase
VVEVVGKLSFSSFIGQSELIRRYVPRQTQITSKFNRHFFGLDCAILQRHCIEVRIISVQMQTIDGSPDATASYISAGFANRMGWGDRPALLLVDVCLAYWTEGSPLDLRGHAPSAAVPESIRRLLAAARLGKVPILWTQGEYTDPDMKDAGLFWLKAKNIRVSLVGGELNHLNGWLEGLEPEKGDALIKKKFPSGFFGTTLASQLHLLNVDTVVVCGVSTSGCVRATVLDAMCHGFRPMVSSSVRMSLLSEISNLTQVVREACGDRTQQIQNANLFDLNAKYADVILEAEAIRKLTAGWA